VAKKKKAEAAPMPQPVSDDKWKAEGDFRTLMDAKEIEGDEERHSKAIAHGHKQKKRMTSVLDLKAAYAEKFGPKKEDDGE
jgi:hypothetical protein